jgi:hypothetical protein
VTDATPGEIERALALFRADVRDDLGELRKTIEQLVRDSVTAAVYQADQRLAEERFRTLRADVDRESREHAAERAAAVGWRERRDAGRRWLIAAVLLPVGGLAVELITILRGAK